MAVLASQVKRGVTCLRETQENIKVVVRNWTWALKNKTSQPFPQEDPPRNRILSLLFSQRYELNEPRERNTLFILWIIYLGYSKGSLQGISQVRMQILGYREAPTFRKHISRQPTQEGEKKATQTPENHMLRFLKGAKMQLLWTETKEEVSCLLSF